MENLLKLIFPPECLFCKTPGDIFCDKCLSEATLLADQRCIVCDRDSDNGVTHAYCKKSGVPSRSLAVFSYEGKVRECIKFSKYGPKQFSALKKLAKEAVGLAVEWGIDFTDYLCVPIPISRKKYNYRGFNQANLIADYFSYRFGVHKDFNVLRRTKETQAQFTLNRKSRFENLQDTFTCLKKVTGQKILLVDDVITTGATFLSAAALLYKEGAQDVVCFALSKRL